MLRGGVTFVMLFAAIAGAGCSRRQAPAPGAASPASATPPVATQPIVTQPIATQPARGGTFDRPKLGVRLEWPAGWVERPSKDYVLLLAVAAGATGAGGEAPSISLDVPDLPPHIPGMIPVGSVRGGYLDDLRKAEGPLKTTDLSPPPVLAAARRMVRSTWTDARGHAWQETALLMVHGDRVYILRARSATTDEPPVRAAFDEVVRSLKWTK
jgi:hypothetical protein